MMAKAVNSVAPQTAKLTPDDMRKGIKRLEKRLAEVELFDPQSLDRNDPWSTVRPLKTSVETALIDTFGQGTIEYNRFSAAAHFDWPIRMGGGVPHHEKVQHVAEDKTRSIQLLKGAIAMLTERLEEIEEEGVAVAPARGIQTTKQAPQSKKIFIVHGQDEGAKEATARFIASLGLQPIILHEQANKGRTIIQKFQEEASDVGFAIVLMTPDDVTASGEKRARQNVILELGFFLGALGPSKVAAIVKDKLETPSDFDGVVYIPFDGHWKMLLAKELEAAAYDIDWNTVMKG